MGGAADKGCHLQSGLIDERFGAAVGFTCLNRVFKRIAVFWRDFKVLHIWEFYLESELLDK